MLWSHTPHRMLKRSHQTRMKRYAQIIYMLSQCKDAIDNPAALFARIEHLTRELKNLNFGGYSCRVNQSGACSSSDVITRRQKIQNNNGGQINRGCMWVPVAVRYYFVLLQKQEYILQ